LDGLVAFRGSVEPPTGVCCGGGENKMRTEVVKSRVQ